MHTPVMMSTAPNIPKNNFKAFKNLSDLPSSSLHSIEARNTQTAPPKIIGIPYGSAAIAHLAMHAVV
jgi:hypothetical protein